MRRECLSVRVLRLQCVLYIEWKELVNSLLHFSQNHCLSLLYPPFFSFQCLLIALLLHFVDIISRHSFLFGLIVLLLWDRRSWHTCAMGHAHIVAEGVSIVAAPRSVHGRCVPSFLFPVVFFIFRMPYLVNSSATSFKMDRSRASRLHCFCFPALVVACEFVGCSLFWVKEKTRPRLFLSRNTVQACKKKKKFQQPTNSRRLTIDYDSLYRVKRLWKLSVRECE